MRRRQSSRCEQKHTAIAARAPGIQAPDSWPKSPRIPQPIDSESATSSRDTGLYNGFAGMVEGLSNEDGDRLATPGRSQRSINDSRRSASSAASPVPSASWGRGPVEARDGDRISARWPRCDRAAYLAERALTRDEPTSRDLQIQQETRANRGYLPAHSPTTLTSTRLGLRPSNSP